VPTGVFLRDAREQLFDAAERVLLRAGPSALTSRAVTDEAGVAKGVLHRHFADFDAFLADLVLDRVARLRAPVPGTGTVVGNLTAALTDLFGSIAVHLVTLITFRDGLRARLRAVRPHGIPLLSEAAEMIADYLVAERDLGRIAADADLHTIGLTLIGSGHLLFAEGAPPGPDAVRRLVTSVVGAALR
jgi:AcrR family transcriptional regulator